MTARVYQLRPVRTQNALRQVDPGGIACINVVIKSEWCSNTYIVTWLAFRYSHKDWVDREQRFDTFDEAHDLANQMRDIQERWLDAARNVKSNECDVIYEEFVRLEHIGSKLGKKSKEEIREMYLRMKNVPLVEAEVVEEAEATEKV